MPGETIPASDSEDEERTAEGELEGAGRERSLWVMQRLAQEAGTGPEVVSVLARRFGASKGLPPGSCPHDPALVQALACRILSRKQCLALWDGAVLVTCKRQASKMTHGGARCCGMPAGGAAGQQPSFDFYCEHVRLAGAAH